ncbi:glycosyl hydrolase family 28 protein [Granulicella sp. WH15]|uniref:glycoside hydrolase family 28 protein n=1 Tax=Granulicella sp. WH15 TaxID=2602070 RepID=UPI0021043A98|nr:glycosyl hydrolase family 28 protein [Granulicella sp. WH15]
MMVFVRLGVVLSMVAGAGFAVAQDTRQVAEPKIPASCVQLSASLRTAGGKIAEADERRLDTDRIQKALDACKPGMAVELKPVDGNNAFLTGPLELRSGVTLLIDEGVTLFASRDPKLFDAAAKPGVCGTIPAAPVPGGGCRPLLSAVNVTDAAVMGDGTIDGRGYAKLIGHDYSWWEMARRAEPKNEKYYSMRLVVANHADGLTLYRITLHNSPNFHVSVNGTNGFTAWAVHLLTPVDKGLDARNTDGIDPSGSTNVTVAHSWIDNGDDNIAIKSGTTHMSVLDNHFYTGHGMSIGSETVGQAYLLVDGLTEDHTSSGIRIKSNVTRGGQVHDLTYRNICMRDVANPVAISPYYTNQTTEGFVDPHYTGDKIPDYKKIELDNVISETPGDVLVAGLDEAHRTEIALHNVVVQGITPQQVHLAYVDIASSGVNFDLSRGTNVKVLDRGKAASGPKDAPAGHFGLASCAKVFVPMR